MPSLFVSELPSLCLGGALSSGTGGDLGPRTGSQEASPDFLPCPYLGPWERLLSLASLHPQGTQLLRKSQLLPSPILSFQTKPVKTDLRWQFRPHLATARVHGPPAGFESQTLSTPDVHETRTDAVLETHPGKICPGTHGCNVFLLAPSKLNGAEYLHPRPSLYCRHRLTALQSCSRRKALLPAGSHGDSQPRLLP